MRTRGTRAAIVMLMAVLPLLTLARPAAAAGFEGAVVTANLHECTGTWNAGPEPTCYYIATRNAGYAGTGPFSLNAFVMAHDGVQTTIWSFSCPAGEQCVSDPTSPPIPGAGAGIYVTVSASGPGGVATGDFG